MFIKKKTPSTSTENLILRCRKANSNYAPRDPDVMPMAIICWTNLGSILVELIVEHILRPNVANLGFWKI